MTLKRDCSPFQSEIKTRKSQGLSFSWTQVKSTSGQINVALPSVCQQFVSSISIMPGAGKEIVCKESLLAKKKRENKV